MYQNSRCRLVKREINKITFKTSSVISGLTSKLCRSMLPAGMIHSLEKQLDGQKTYECRVQSLQSWSVHGLWRSSHISMLCHAVPHLGLIRFNIRPISKPWTQPTIHSFFDAPLARCGSYSAITWPGSCTAAGLTHYVVGSVMYLASVTVNDCKCAHLL
jgi:hypothetical protein